MNERGATQDFDCHVREPGICTGAGWVAANDIVIVDFWATWCGPCIRSIPKTNKMMEKYGDKVVIIGICHPRGSDKMAAVAKKHGIKFPIAIDPGEKTDVSYKVNGYPDYFIIDQTGKLVVADCANDEVEAVVDKLLKK